MAISLARVGIWRCVAIGVLLDLSHAVLQVRWKFLSPHFVGPRPMWGRVLLVAEYVMLLLSFGVAMSTIESLIRRRTWTPARIGIIVAVLAGYFALFAWTFR